MKNYFELIENYIDNELNDEELKQVELLLKTNKEFAKEYQLRIDVNNVIAENDIINLRKAIQRVFKNSKKNTGKTIRKLYTNKWHLVAATITIFVIIGSLLYSPLQGPPKSSDIFSQYYQPETSIMATRSTNADNDTNIRTALQLYSNAEYEKAITIFEGLDKNIISKFYLGLSYIEIQEFTKAKKSFQAVINHGDNLFLEQAEWYTALCCLKLNNHEEAVKLFSKIKNSNSVYKDQSLEILQSMN